MPRQMTRLSASGEPRGRRIWRPQRTRWGLKKPAKCKIQYAVPKERRYADDLPFIAVSKLRAARVITAETTEFVVRLGDVEQTVGVALRRFPNGGSWSLFVCPTCGGRAQSLRLLNGVLVCRRCRLRRGVRMRSEPTGLWQRAAMRIPKLLAMLDSDKPLRLKPSTMRGKLERRRQHEASLQRCLLLVRRYELAAREKALAKTKG
jgi:hypothetical protein